MTFTVLKIGLLPKNIVSPSLVFFGVLGLSFPFETTAAENACSVRWKLAVCQPASFRSHGKTYAEMEEERRIVRLKAEAERRANAWPTEFVKISDHMKSPNKVRIPFAQAPAISAKTRQVDGRRVCEHKKDNGNKSKQSGKDAHVDKECCLDPDEIPNPRCYYPKLGANNSPERVVGAGGKKQIK